MGFTLVEPDLGAPLHVRVEDPLYNEECAFDTADLAQRDREIVLARVGSELAQELAGSDLAGGHSGGAAEKIRPVRNDQFLADFAAYQLAQLFGCRIGIEHVQPLRWQVSDAQDEPVTEHGAGPEQMIGEAGRVGILLANLTANLVHQEAIENIRRLADGGRNRL